MEAHMLPIILDVSKLRVALIGQGLQALRRLQLIDEAQAENVQVFSEQPDQDLRDLAGGRLVEALPGESEIASFNVVYVAGVSTTDQERFTAWARAHKTLINVEDVRPLCDFHVPARLRYDDLLFTVSTGGMSPGLARRFKKDLAAKYPPIWGERLDILAKARQEWIAQGLSFDDLVARSDAFIREKEWFDE